MLVLLKRNEYDVLFDVVELGSDPRDRFRYNGFDLVDLKKAIKSQGEFAGEPMLGLLYLLKTMIRQEPLADLVMTRVLSG